MNEPVVPVPPKLFEEEHEALLADDHAITALDPLVMIAGVADVLTMVIFAAVGAGATVVTVPPPPPPHEARPETVVSTAKVIPSRNLELNAGLFDMIVSL